MIQDILIALAIATTMTLISILLVCIEDKTAGILFRLQSFWIGLHYSKQCKRYCLNIIPCLTIWWISGDGLAVDKTKM